MEQGVYGECLLCPLYPLLIRVNNTLFNFAWTLSQFIQPLTGTSQRKTAVNTRTAGENALKLLKKISLSVIHVLKTAEDIAPQKVDEFNFTVVCIFGGVSQFVKQQQLPQFSKINKEMKTKNLVFFKVYSLVKLSLLVNGIVRLDK